ncbi:hypothetical protein [Natronorubrum daqingense]|nr:hypothetical protein [Natronorubrum daqingense]
MNSDRPEAADLTAATFEAALEPLRMDENLTANGGDEAASGGGL